ncbi:MAG: hypothetical protein HIU93_05855 [Acidobacteria bacterium]|nr:hypothetical protein [Acidobacteriota bacterium]MBW4044976.1 hypothetical protein [Acidobacteriota bacterium]
MRIRTGYGSYSTLGCVLFTVIAAAPVAVDAQSADLNPAKMPRLGSVSERYQSFNVEMLEVTGGQFWVPYNQASEHPPASVASNQNTPAGMDPSLYRYRSPIDLTNPRLRRMAAALGRSYLRVSGTWANSTYFEDTAQPQLTKPPAGFKSVLTRKQWKGVVDFAHAVNADIVTSFAISPGVRDAQGMWTPVEARKFLAYTKSIGGSIAAAEMFNEPNFASMGGAPQGYDAKQYGKDFQAFEAFVREAAPAMKVLGPGSVGEGQPLGDAVGIHMLRSEDMLAAMNRKVDVFSYHFYGGVSQRCVRPGTTALSTPDKALTREWLFRTVADEKYYAKLRDRFDPGKPIWVTETGETACGGNPWAADFIDSFRYLNQLGVLAKLGVQVVMHNTLAASDYALIDERTLQPRPNYWSALLWRKLMGTTVLDAGPSPSADLYLYAHCLRGRSGDVALLAINADRSESKEVSLPVEGERYTLSAANLMDNKVDLNGQALELTADGNVPALHGVETKRGKVVLPAASITFIALDGVKNASCQ